MSQTAIIQLLKKNKRTWFPTREISEYIGVSIGSTTTSLKSIRNSIDRAILKGFAYELKRVGHYNIYHYRAKW